MPDTAIPVGLPAWFDAAKHVVGPGGIYEANTGVLLAEDGEPASDALRAARAAFAEVAKKERKPRDTRQIVEGAALAAAEKE
jgi:hypothetical protein